MRVWERGIHTRVGSELVQAVVIVGLVHDVPQFVDRAIPGCERCVLAGVGQLSVLIVRSSSNSSFVKVEFGSLLPINMLAILKVGS
jgi:hypothetical protein